MKSLSVKFLIITFIFSFLITSKSFSRNIDLGLLKEACTETGLQSGTEDHADCVMRLYKRDDLVLYEKPNRHNNNTLKIYDPWEEFRAREAAREARRAARSANSSDNTLDSLLTLGIIIGGAYMLGNAGSFNTYNSGNSNLGTSLGIIGLSDSYQSGHNKTCVYNTVSGKQVVTMQNSVAVCPLVNPPVTSTPTGVINLKNSYQSGHNKVCVYNTISGEQTMTLSNSVATCPLKP